MSDIDQITNFSTPKVNRLIEILKNVRPQNFVDPRKRKDKNEEKNELNGKGECSSCCQSGRVSAASTNLSEVSFDDAESTEIKSDHLQPDQEEKQIITTNGFQLPDPSEDDTSSQSYKSAENVNGALTEDCNCNCHVIMEDEETEETEKKENESPGDMMNLNFDPAALADVPKDSLAATLVQIMPAGKMKKRREDVKEKVKVHNPDDPESVCALIFVKERNTAKIIYRLLKVRF